MRSTPATVKKKDTDKKRSQKPFLIVGIGASAGGLEAATALITNLAPDTGMAFVYVQHLSPDHKSMLTALLSRSTKITVQEATDKLLIEPDHFYVIPPDKEMTVTDGHIKLTRRKKDRSVNLPVDVFFGSLAEKHPGGVIGVILSGNANDGSLGLGAIKAAGGLTFAQDSSAKFNGMPKSAISAGVVDFILAPKDIARELNRISKYDNPKQKIANTGKEDVIDNNNPHLKSIFTILYERMGVDFSHYKMSTIKRRILRRMMLYNIKTLKEYAKLVEEKSDEASILYQDMLINVTSFFRDPDACLYLKNTLLPRLHNNKKDGETLRIWVTACSTGEEAYSIAMILLEIQGKKSSQIPVQIFATDLSAQAIAKARIGEYQAEEIKSVSPQRLQRFFTKSGTKYRIAKAVRDICAFSPHNVLSDPPFSRVDFISCCNMLIYLDLPAQRKVITTFHYALQPQGYLMLGKSETIGTSDQLFSTTNQKYKLYSVKKNSVARLQPDLMPQFLKGKPGAKNIPVKTIKATPDQTHALGSAIDRILLTQYLPASVVINYDQQILEFRGATDLYLTHSSGKATLNILKLTRPEIAFELRIAIQKAIRTKQAARKENIEMKVNGSLRLFSIVVAPLQIEGEEPFLLVLFSEQKTVEIIATDDKTGKSTSLAKDRRIKKLETELAIVRADMLAYAQEQETITEELQSVNEEVVSNNEELQTLNEELETSKEEIDSANEELIVANQELQTRNELLMESYEYSEAIISTIHEPIVILDTNLRIRSANNTFYKTFNINKQTALDALFYEVGDKQWDIPRLRALLEDIITKSTRLSNVEITHTFPGIGKRIMLLNANRIIQKNHREQLILLAIADVTEILQQQEREKALLYKNIEESKLYTRELEESVLKETNKRKEADKTLLQKEEEISVSGYNKRFLTEFSDEFAIYRIHNKFFNSLALFIAEFTGLDYVLVGKTEDTNTHEPVIQTIAITSFGKLTKNIKFPLLHGPAEQVINGAVRAYPEQCRQTFPEDQMLTRLKVEGYLGYPLLDVEGKAMGLIAIMHQQKIKDPETVTSILEIVARRAELELTKIKYELALERNNTSLEEKNQALEAVNHELKSFTYISSHDLQEPLRKIQAFSALILEKEKQNLSDSGKDYLQRMNSAASRMQKLLEDLLTYSRANAADRTYENVYLDKVVEEVKTDLKEDIERKNAVIEVTGVCVPRVIPFQFYQVIYNLLSNALKFSNAEAPPHIVVKGKIASGNKLKNTRLFPKQRYCHIVVKDNGIGFEPQFSERIFEVFQKLHGKEEYEGTGIGLAIVKKIVENHNGIIIATSQLGKGATFDIYLPSE
ncbi:chemotaxis protein CheB [Chitinophaga barathri]|uniref:PAS domain-containing protein n=1 Tax=Chitinophaga barathri TaxID=1647451 RepID=A0A3N4MDE0_9BACT|nr:chemotaxis protein CheB [Chitinophaga barathri]RPD39956.1 hypothetical protein EG028_17695 [Chitinophaga barathri]